MLPFPDTVDILKGSWKLPIIISLTFGTKRFKQISKEVNGITDKMLSKKLKDLEVNKLVKDSFPPTVKYSITTHGRSLEKVIDKLRLWRIEHRKNHRKVNITLWGCI